VSVGLKIRRILPKFHDLCGSIIKLSALVALSSCFVLNAFAESQPLLQVGQEPAQATLANSTETGDLLFRVDDQEQQVTQEKLLRWSTPRSSQAASELVLIDGSHLVLAESWAGKSVLRLEAETVAATTKLLGEVSFARAKLRAILLRAPTDPLERVRLLEELTAAKQIADRLIMSSGDIITGRCLEIGEAIWFEAGGTGKPLELPLSDEIVGIALGGVAPNPNAGRIVVGLRDGSLLVAESLVAGADQLRLKLAGDMELSGDGLRDVVYLRSITSSAKYLSDLEPAAYRHVPYLEIPWRCRRDRNVLGGPLAVAGRTYPKGLGMHSASRLTYDLQQEPLKEYARFVSQVALDDASTDRGSVVFRVYLRKADDWQEAYSSPVMRGGDPPQKIAVELGAATQIALVTDYADRGDERDYANWLDARLE